MSTRPGHGDTDARIILGMDHSLPAEEEKAILSDAERDAAFSRRLEDYTRQDELLRRYFDAHLRRFEGFAFPALEAVDGSYDRSSRAALTGWLLAATLLAIVLATTAILLGPATAPLGSVVDTRGVAQAFEGLSPHELQSNTPLGRDVRRIKTSSTGHLEIALAEANGTFELAPGSSIEVTESTGDKTLSLERGEILVHLQQADETKDLLTVRTGDLTARTGKATFAVVRGLRGSEIHVLEGEVEVEARGERRLLVPGDRLSSLGGEATSTHERIAWSNHRDRLAERLVALGIRPPSPLDSSSTTLRRTRTLDFIPAHTLLLVDVGDFSELLSPLSMESPADLLQSEQLEAALLGALQASDIPPQHRDTIVQGAAAIIRNRDLTQLFSAFSDSVTLALTPRNIVLIADVSSKVEQVQELMQRHDTVLDERVFAQIQDGYLVFSPDAATGEDVVRRIAGREDPASVEPLLQDVLGVAQGSVLTTAVSVRELNEQIRAHSGQEAEARKTLRRLGLTNMRSIVASGRFRTPDHNQALSLLFDGKREGILGWMDQPGPLGSLQFFSPDTYFLNAMKIRRPEEMLEEVLAWFAQDNPGAALSDNEEQVRLAREIAQSLGNEVAIGLGNPVLPIPNIKVVVEVLDPERFDRQMESLFTLLRQTTPETGRLMIHRGTYRGYPVVELQIVGKPFNICYGLVEDYAVFGPGRAFVQNTIDMAREGRSLERETAFQQSLPQKSGSHVSGLYYQAIPEKASEVLPLIQGMLPEAFPVDLFRLVETVEGSGAVAYAIARKDRVDFYIEGIRTGDFRAAGWVPAVAEWASQ